MLKAFDKPEPDRKIPWKKCMASRVHDETAPMPSRLPAGHFVFDDFPEFRPNLSPKEIFQLGAFGGTYFRPIYSAVNKRDYTAKEVIQEYPRDWWDGLNICRQLTSAVYRKSVNKYKVKAGGGDIGLKIWEGNGWISNIDPYGWNQWYCRFWLGRRSTDDARQIKRWTNFSGERGRWRLRLIGELYKSGGDVCDDSLFPMIRQMLLHWAYALCQEDFDGLVLEKSIKLRKWKLKRGLEVAPQKDELIPDEIAERRLRNKFKQITNCTWAEARHLLEKFEYELEPAVNYFWDHQLKSGMLAPSRVRVPVEEIKDASENQFGGLMREEDIGPVSQQFKNKNMRELDRMFDLTMHRFEQEKVKTSQDWVNEFMGEYDKDPTMDFTSKNPSSTVFRRTKIKRLGLGHSGVHPKFAANDGKSIDFDPIAELLKPQKEHAKIRKKAAGQYPSNLMRKRGAQGKNAPPGKRNEYNPYNEE